MCSRKKTKLVWCAVAPIAVLSLTRPLFAQTATYTWNGSAGDGVWNSGASQGNWDGGTYSPGNGGGNNFVFVDSAYNQAVTTINLLNGHNPNIDNLTLNSSIVVPLDIVIGNGSHLDMVVVSGLDTLDDSSKATVTIDAVGTGTLALFGGASNIGTYRVSGGSTLVINAPVADTSVTYNRGMSKRGGGTLVLTAASPFDGPYIAGDGVTQVPVLANVGTNSPLGNGLSTATITLSTTSGTNGTLVYTGGDTSTNRPLAITSDVNNATQSGTFTTTTGVVTFTGGIATAGTANTSALLNFNVGGAGNVNINTNGINGFLNLVKIGAGTVQVNADSLWLGGTVVKGGTLLVNANHTPSAGVGTYEVMTGGTLGGTGTISSAITVDSGGSIRPGNLGGTLTAQSTVDIEGNFAIDILAGGTAAKLQAGGAVTLGTLAMIAVNSAGGLALGTTVDVLNAPAGIAGQFSNLNAQNQFSDGTNIYQVNYAATDVSLTVVPEPGTIAALGLLGVLSVRRRRSNAAGVNHVV